MSRMLMMHPGLFGEANLNKPASNEFIQSLQPNQIFIDYLQNNQSQHQCSICLAAFEIGDEATKLPCEHFFHLICIKVWLSKVKFYFNLENIKQ